MNKEVARKWVEALRSGKYQQASGALRRASGGMCCVGVLCDLYVREHQGGEGWTPENDVILNGEELPTCYLPNSDAYPIGTWVGMPRVGSGFDFGVYAVMNDDGKSFLEIASQIERDAGLLEPEKIEGVE